MPLYIMLIAILASSGGLLLFMHLAFRSAMTDPIKFGQRGPSKLPPGKLARTVIGNSMFSAAFVFAACYGFYDFLFGEAGGGSAWSMILEIVGALLLYDIIYYLMHRYPFHRWQWLRKIHTVHHTVKHPTAFESLYMHPVENFAGLALLMLCTYIVGPVSTYSFAIIFTVYSYLNILIHCGMDSPFSWLRPIAFMAKKHDRHHKSMQAGNYASITPLPDILFGTMD